MASTIPLFAGPEPVSSAAILQELRSFREFGTVLYVAAHPDDENTQLLTYLARGRGYRTAYLSVTRGDGGQNLIGPEFDEELGVIRTQELLAARRLDGGRQFFTRAIDFGYSKDPEETLRIWNKQEVLSDVVRVFRTFRPDVVVAGFPQQQPGQHGHHIASARLALEAFKLAGDPKAFPEQLGPLEVWQPKRILQGRFGGRGGPGGNPDARVVRMDIGGTDPASGEGFGSIAGRSRAMHKSQGFDRFGRGGGGGGGGPQPQDFLMLDGAPATNDIMDGVETTWARVPHGAEIAKLTDETIAKFNADDPAASVPALLAIHEQLNKLSADRIVDEKRRQFDRILQHCLGLSVQTTVPDAEVAPGETLKLHHTASIRSNFRLRWVASTYPALNVGVTHPIDLTTNTPATRESSQTLPTDTPLSQPYWLRGDPTTGTYHVDDPALIGQPENPPAFPVQHVFEVNGRKLIIADEPIAAATISAPFEKQRRLAVIPPVALKLDSEVKLFAPGADNTVEVEVRPLRPGTASGTVQFRAAAGWKITPPQQTFRVSAEPARLKFTVTAPREAGGAVLTAQATVNGRVFNNEEIEIKYNHIPVQVLLPPARTKAVSLDLATRGKKIGYVAGAGDSVAECLAQMGYSVTSLTGADLTTNKLKDFDAVVFGIRAFEVRRDLAAQMDDLFAYVEGGGNVVVQYNRNVNNTKLAPYDLRVTNERVTDEHAAMTFLAPEHPVLNAPNKITPADFEGWVQERGIYFPNDWDKEHFTPILACNDPGEQPKSGGLLVAKYGRGYYVYTGLVFFRELPDGVPGAYRLFANLVSLGK